MRWRTEHVNEELLAYLDEELSVEARARVETHLEGCEACRQELEQLQRVRAGLAATLPSALARKSLPPAAETRIREALQSEQARQSGSWWRRWWQLVGIGEAVWRRRVALTYIALIMMVAGFGLGAWQNSRIAETSDVQETLVLAQNQLAAGNPAALRVLVRKVRDETPVPDAEVTVSLTSRAPGMAREVLFVGRTDGYGTADVQFTVPERLEGAEDLLLVVETRSEKGQDEVTHPIQVVRRHSLLLSSDKPVYQPGQAIHMRTLALDSMNRQPVRGREVVFVVRNPNGDQLVRQSVKTSDYGIAGFSFPLDSQAPHGTYTLRADLGDTSSERTVSVESYALPQFRLALETARDFYQPGDHVQGTVQADYFFGKPVAGAEVTLRGYAYPDAGVQEQVFEIYGRTDGMGRFDFSFDLPAGLVVSGPNRGDAIVSFSLSVEVVDTAGQRETIGQRLPVSQALILVDSVPESGTLKPGVENVVFMLTSYPDGRPAETTLDIETESGRRETLQTGPYGLAEFRFVPTRDQATLQVTARDAAGAQAVTTLRLDVDTVRQALLLRAEKAVYRVGQTLRLEALVADPAAQAVYLDVVKAGQTILTTVAPVGDEEQGQAVFAIDLDERFWGTLELHAYRVLADGEIVRDTRLVVVEAPAEIAVDVTSDRESYRPGDTAGLEIETREKTDGATPVQTALGIGIVDESVYALQEQTPGFARVYFLLQKELLEPQYQVHGFRLPALFEAEPDTPLREAQDRSARAAWADVPAPPPNRWIHSYADKLAALLSRELAALEGLADWLVRALVALPLLLALVTIWGLQPTGALNGALKRLLKAVAVLVLTSPVAVPALGGLLWLAREAAGSGVLVLTLLAWLMLWVSFVRYAWRESDKRSQIAGGLVSGYLLMGAVMVFVAAQGGELAATELLGISLAYLLALTALVILGQGLVVEGARRAGWVLTLLGVMLVPLTFFAAGVPSVTSPFTRALGSPLVYALPGGALTGCGGAGDEPGLEPPVESTRMIEQEEAAESEPTSLVVLSTSTPAPPSVTTSPATTPPGVEVTPAPGADLPRLRQFFPETLYWVAETVTDEQGYLALDVPLADSITTWRLQALASSSTGALGAATHDIRVFQPFFIDFNLPQTLTQGDEVRVPVVVYNYVEQKQTVHLSLSSDTSDGASLILLEDERVVTVAGNQVAMAYFTLRAQGYGNGRLTLVAESDRASDAVARPVQVAPDGTEVQETLSNRLGQGVDVELALPETAIEGTGRLEVRLYGDHVAQLLQGLASMLHMPAGCFEQISAVNYPNVLILQGAELSPPVRLQAEHYVATGYQRLLTYEVPGGGFSLFGDAPASLIWTAYGLMQLDDMAQVYPVDPAVVRRTAEWLFGQQAGDGRWDPRALDPSHHDSASALADAQLPATAYVTWALAEAGYHDDPRLQFALNYLVRNLDKASDAYVLALVSNALSAVDPASSAARAALDRLQLQAQVEGDVAYWSSGIESITGAVGASADLETTALATFALLRDGRYADRMEQGLSYLIQTRDEDGGWHTSQATVLALKTFNLAAESWVRLETTATVTVSLDGRPVQRVNITPENASVVHTVYVDDVAPGSHQLRLDVAGDGTALLYQAVLAYYVPWEAVEPSGEEDLLDIDVTYDRTTLKVDETLVADVRLALNEPGTAQWVLVELGLPPGFAPVAEDLEALIAQSASQETQLKRYEVAGQSLRLYLENLSAPVQFNFRLRAGLVIEAQTGPAVVYDYYNPALRSVQSPTMVKVEP